MNKPKSSEGKKKTVKPNIYRDIDRKFKKEYTYLDENGKRFLLGGYDEKRNESTDNIDEILDFIHKQIDKTNREWEKKINDLLVNKSNYLIELCHIKGPVIREKVDVILVRDIKNLLKNNEI